MSSLRVFENFARLGASRNAFSPLYRSANLQRQVRPFMVNCAFSCQVSAMQGELFGKVFGVEPTREVLSEGAALLRGRALELEAPILAALNDVTARAPFRNMVTPGGFVMSVGMTNCGAVGWVTDRTGYRYDATDPMSGRPWPAMPACFAALAAEAASECGYAEFAPDSCLINRYRVGTRLSLHQDKNERDFAEPIVSVSLGLPATFQFGGLRRAAAVQKYTLRHGDVVVWGGPSRLVFHGVLALKAGEHPMLGCTRINLTFRRAR